MAIPFIVGFNGAKKVMEIPLNQEEAFALKTSAETLKSTLIIKGFEGFLVKIEVCFRLPQTD